MKPKTIKTNNGELRIYTSGRRIRLDQARPEWAGRNGEPEEYFRFRGQRHYLSDFTASTIEGWDGIAPDSFFSGTLVRFDPEDSDYVYAALYCC